MKSLAPIAVWLCLAGCISPAPTPQPAQRDGYRWSYDAETAAMPGDPTTAAPGTGPLRARDGSVVAAQPPGSLAQQEVLQHEMQPTATGRMYLLELYQQAIDERDALELEVSNLSRSVDQMRREKEQLMRELDGKQAELAGAEQEIVALLGENQDLAARLATAQIRRLEAEHMLLEAKLEWLLASEAQTAGAPRRATSTAEPARSPVDPATGKRAGSGQ